VVTIMGNGGSNCARYIKSKTVNQPYLHPPAAAMPLNQGDFCQVLVKIGMNLAVI